MRRNRRLEKSNNNNRTSSRISYPGINIDLSSYSVKINEQEVNLSPKEFELLALLAQNSNKIFSNEQLYQKLWVTGSFGDYRTVMVHISNLRKKIEQDPKNPVFIHTIKGVGYKFSMT